MCNQINTDVILANLFASRNTYPSTYSFEQIEDYFLFLVESWPCYLCSDFSKQEVKKCVQYYPELYCLCGTLDGDWVVQSGELLPNLKFFNATYPGDVARYIESISKDYQNNFG